MSQKIDKTNFENDFNGWEFKSWMPEHTPWPPGTSLVPSSRVAECKFVSDQGCHTPGVLQFLADGGGDDGIFFIEKLYNATANQPYSRCSLTWWVSPDIKGDTNRWPCVVYVGKPKKLDTMETQHDFVWIDVNVNKDVKRDPNIKNWIGLAHQEQFLPLEVVQVCIGWKIIYEVEREYLLDDIEVILD